MSQNNAARPFYLVSDREASSRAKPLPIDQRPSGIGLIAAVLASLALWLGLLWLGALVVGIFTG